MQPIRNILEIRNQAANGMIFLVTDTGDRIFIRTDANVKFHIDVQPVAGPLIYMYDASESQAAIGVSIYEPNFYTFDWNVVTFPVTANAGALLLAIVGYFPAAGGGGGDATAANQVIEQGLLTDIKNNTAPDALVITQWLRLIGYASAYGIAYGELIWRSQMGRLDTFSSPLNTASDTVLSNVSIALATLIQNEIQARQNKTILDVQSGINTFLVLGIVTHQGWAIVTWQDSIV